MIATPENAEAASPSRKAAATDNDPNARPLYHDERDLQDADPNDELAALAIADINEPDPLDLVSPPAPRQHSEPQPRIDFADINRAALGHLESLAREWFPQGNLAGREWCVGSLSGEPGSSLKINLDSGKWKDFAGEDGGGDPISLFAALRGITQIEAARDLAGIPQASTKKPKADWRPITPIPTDAPPPPARHWKHGTPSASWTYHNADAVPIMVICRFDHGSGKEILPLTYCENPDGSRSWRWQNIRDERPLYGLELLAENPDLAVVVVEGEKAADALRGCVKDHIAITWPGGSGATGKTDWRPLAGRSVIIWPDRDAPGAKAGTTIASALAGIAGSIRMITPPAGDADGWDAADAVADGVDIRQLIEAAKANPTTATIAELVAARTFNAAIVPPPPIPILSIGKKIISTPGNLLNIQAPAKAGKSAALAGMLASLFTNDPAADCLGFISENPSGRAVIHLDTEQSRYDADQLIRRAMRRAGIHAPPGWFYSVSIADLDQEKRWAAWHHIIKAGERDHGGIFMILIDGIADLVKDPNNPEESFAVVADLHSLAIKLDCAIITVLHENPGSDIGKTRGHLGSQLERKAETNLRLAKDAAGVTTIWTDRARHGHIPKDQGSCFEWSDQAGMHISCGTAREIKDLAERHAMEEDVARCIGAVTKTMTYSEVVGYIGEALALKERAAKNRITKWQLHGFITKQPDGKYTRNQ